MTRAALENAYRKMHAALGQMELAQHDDDQRRVEIWATIAGAWSAVVQAEEVAVRSKLPRAEGAR